MTKKTAMFMFSAIKKKVHRMLCSHDYFTEYGRLGPTMGHGKVWVACRCDQCGQWFVYNLLSGRRHMTKGPGFGFKETF